MSNVCVKLSRLAIGALEKSRPMIVCETESLLTHVTFVPFVTVRDAGSNVELEMLMDANDSCFSAV